MLALAAISDKGAARHEQRSRSITGGTGETGSTAASSHSDESYEPD